MSIHFDPNSIVLNKTVSAETARTLSHLAAICGVSSVHFSAVALLRNARVAIGATTAMFPEVSDFASEHVRDFDSAMTELLIQETPDLSQIHGFTTNKLPALSLLTNLTGGVNPQIDEIVGNLLVVALLTDRPLPKNRSQRLLSLVNALKREPHLNTAQLLELQKLQTRSREELLEVLSLCLARSDRSHLRFNATLLIHLRSGLNSQHQEEQRGANLRIFLNEEEARKQIEELKDSTNHGDLTSLFTLVACSLGLPFKLTLDIPLLPGQDQKGLLAWIDPLRGTAYFSTALLLRELGQPVLGALQTSDVYQLHLPTYVSDRLRVALFERPDTRTLGDFLNKEEIHPTDLNKYWGESARGRLIRSVAALSLGQRKNRVASAYSFLAFHLLTAPDLHYLHVAQQQIDDLRQEVLSNLSLPVARENTLTEKLGVGSRRTATKETIAAVFRDLDLAVSEVRVGKRYSLRGLIDHHNSYTRRVAMFLQLAAGGRNVSTIEFLASAWFVGSLFGFLDDKSTGAAGGKTPVPISPLMCEQLRLWELHLKSLEQRLLKLLGINAKDARLRIQKILARKEISIFFLLDENATCKELKAEDLFSGAAAHLNRDWGRHAVASALVQEDAPLAQVHRFLRHQGNAINPNSASGTDVHHDHLLILARRIDLFLGCIPLAPLPGLGGGAK